MAPWKNIEKYMKKVEKKIGNTLKKNWEKVEKKLGKSWKIRRNLEKLGDDEKWQTSKRHISIIYRSSSSRWAKSSSTSPSPHHQRGFLIRAHHPVTKLVKSSSSSWSTPRWACAPAWSTTWSANSPRTRRTSWPAGSTLHNVYFVQYGAPVPFMTLYSIQKKGWIQGQKC